MHPFGFLFLFFFEKKVPISVGANWLDSALDRRAKSVSAKGVSLPQKGHPVCILYGISDSMTSLDIAYFAISFFPGSVVVQLYA